MSCGGVNVGLEQLGVAFHHEDVSVGDPGIERVGVIVERLSQIEHDGARLLGGNVPRRVAAHDVLLDGDEVESERHLVRREFDPHARRLDGSASDVVGFRIVAEDGHTRCRGGRLHPLGHGLREPDGALGGDAIKMRCRGSLECRTTAKLRKGPSSSAVQDYDDVLHRLLPPLTSISPTRKGYTNKAEYRTRRATGSACPGRHAAARSSPGDKGAGWDCEIP